MRHGVPWPNGALIYTAFTASKEAVSIAASASHRFVSSADELHRFERSGLHCGTCDNVAVADITMSFTASKEAVSIAARRNASGRRCVVFFTASKEAVSIAARLGRAPTTPPLPLHRFERSGLHCGLVPLVLCPTLPPSSPLRKKRSPLRRNGTDRCSVDHGNFTASKEAVSIAAQFAEAGVPIYLKPSPLRKKRSPLRRSSQKLACRST